jgi:hypothetical protein
MCNCLNCDLCGGCFSLVIFKVAQYIFTKLNVYVNSLSTVSSMYILKNY